MLATVRCKKCNITFKLDIGDKSPDEVVEGWKNIDSFHCKVGCHVELSSPANYWNIISLGEGHAPSDEEFMERFKGRETWTTEEFSQQFKDIGFCAPCVTGTHIPTGRKMVLEFCHTPSGKRIYD